MAQITKNGPASKTDLKEGDIITQIDVNTMNDLSNTFTQKSQMMWSA